MRYRVKQVGNNYYPQHKFLWLFWCNFKSGMNGIGYYDTVFWSLEAAMNYLDEVTSNEKIDKSVSIHKY